MALPPMSDEPPWGEEFSGGLSNPTGRGRRGRGGPAISVDPNTLSMIGRAREAVRGLTSQMKGLADQAERYARAMGSKAAGWGGGGRPANMPEPTLHQRLMDEHNLGRTPLGGQPPGGGQPGTFGGLGGVELAILLPQLTRAFSSQLGAVIDRERVTTRLAMAQTGVYSGQQMAQPWQRMLRGATGYTSTGDLYAGAGVLGQAGLLRGPNDPRTRELTRQTGLAAIQGGTNYQTAAQTVAGFRDPNIVNALRQGLVGGRSITAPFAGGGMQVYGRQGVLEQVYGAMGGAKRSEDFYRTGLAPGGAMARTLGAAGFGQEQQELVQQYGIMRSEHPEWSPEKVQKELQQRYKDTGETLRQFQQSVSELKDVFVTGLLPIVQGLVMVLKPMADVVRTIGERFPIVTKLLGAAASALIIFAAATKIATMAQRWGGAMGAAGIPGGGALSGAGGLLGKVAGPLAVAAGGYVLGEGTQSVISGGQTTGGRHKAGQVVGGAITGAGLGFAVGSALAPLSLGISIPVATGIGAAIGGVAGLFGMGDAWSDAVAAGGHDGSPQAPAGGAVSGATLRGAKTTDANLNPDFAKRLQQMFADNPALTLTSGWRDSAAQADLYRKKPNLAAPPGKSNHEKGLAADIGPESQYGWIAANAGKYGLFLPMPDSAERKAKKKKIEPWHVEPVGGGSGMAAALATATAAGGGTSPTPRTAAAKPASPEARAATAIRGGQTAWQEAVAANLALGGSQVGDAWEGGDSIVFPSSQGSGGGRVGNITIGRIEINLSIARGTYEEADRTARYLGTLLGDRDRMLALARGGS